MPEISQMGPAWSMSSQMRASVHRSSKLPCVNRVSTKFAGLTVSTTPCLNDRHKPWALDLRGTPWLPGFVPLRGSSSSARKLASLSWKAEKRRLRRPRVRAFRTQDVRRIVCRPVDIDMLIVTALCDMRVVVACSVEGAMKALMQLLQGGTDTYQTTNYRQSRLPMQCLS